MGTGVGTEFALGGVSVVKIWTGRAAATVNVLRHGVPVRLDSGGGNDAVTVGNTTNGVQSILGPLAVHNGPAFSTLSVDDSAGTTARTITLSVTGSSGTISGLAPVPITYATGDVSSVSLVTGHGADTVNVPSTAAFIPLTLNSSGGNDQVNVGNTTNGVQSILG